MQTLLSQEEKDQLSNFFRDLGWMFSDLGVDDYNYKEDAKASLLKADHQKMAVSLADIHQKYKEIIEWMK